MKDQPRRPLHREKPNTLYVHGIVVHQTGICKHRCPVHQVDTSHSQRGCHLLSLQRPILFFTWIMLCCLTAAGTAFWAAISCRKSRVPGLPRICFSWSVEAFSTAGS